MAVHNLDELNKALGITTGPKEREFAWLWMFLKRTRRTELDPNLFGSHQARDQMAFVLNTSPQVKEQVLGMMKSHLLPDQAFSWITQESRQLRWLDHELTKHERYYSITLPPQLAGRERLIMRIDALDIPPTEKLLFLNRMEQDWGRLRGTDKMFAWFKAKDQADRCSTAWEWLSTHYPSHTSGKASFKGYLDLLSFFDQTNWGDAEKDLCVLKIKRRWGQKAYREKLQDKKQYNFVLSDETNQKLDQLAKKHALKRNQILEILIKTELNQELYIPEHLSSRPSLL